MASALLVSLAFRQNRWVFHGTRKNAVNNLLEVGCSEARVAAIVNMSPAMVHHYSKKVSQFRLARAAMEQFEAGWEKLRPSVLGNVKVVK
jgi:predicted transcriptional regulator